MKFEATASQILALMELAELDQMDEAASRVHQPGRGTLARGIPRLLLDRYELLLQVGRTPVVVPIARGTCSACHMRLPTMVDSMARRAASVHTCPNCRRMLFAPEVVREGSRPNDAKPSPRTAPVPAGRRS